MSFQTSQTFWERWSDFVTRRSRPILAVILTLTVFFTFCLFRTRVGTDFSDFHVKDSNDLINTIQYGFDEGSYLYIVFESGSDKSLLTPELLKQQFRVMQKIKENFNVRTRSIVEAIDEGLRRNKGKSILDVTDYSEIGEAILALSGPRTVVDLEKVSSHFLSNPEAIDFYTKFRVAASVAGAGGGGKLSFDIPFVKAIRAYVQLEAKYTLDEEKEIHASIRDIAESSSTPELKLYAISSEVVIYDVDKQVRKNAILMGLILLFVDIFFLWGEFRKGKEIFLVLFILATSCIWTFGMASLLGVRLSFLHIIALPILLGVGIDNSFVFGRRLSEERKKGKVFSEAIRTTFKETGLGIFLATITTFIAFLSSALTSSVAGIASFNLLVALSMAICLVITITLQGAIRMEAEKRFPSPLPSPSKGEGEKDSLPSHRGGWSGLIQVKAIFDRIYLYLNKIADGFANLGSRGVTSHRRLILMVSAVFIIIALISSLGIETEFDYGIFLKKGMPTYLAERREVKYFGRSRAGYILIEGDVENPVLLEKMKLLEDKMVKYPHVEKVLGRANVDSINDLIYKMRYSLPAGASVKEIFDIITNSEETGNHVLDESYRELASHMVRKKGDHYDGLLMTFFLEETDANKTQAICDALEKDMKSLKFNEIPGIHTRIGGGLISFHLEQKLYFRNFVESFFITLVMNFIVILAAWRKFWQSLVAVAPIIVAVILTLGFMPIFNIKLNLMNVCLGSIIVGLGDDYPIHITERFAEGRRKGLGKLEAARNALSSLGSNIMACAMTSIFGFGAACVLAMPVAESFGILISISLFFVFVASIFILPVLLIGRKNNSVAAPAMTCREDIC